MVCTWKCYAIYFINLYVAMDEEHIQDINENFNQLAPKLFLYEREGPVSLRITQELRKFYLKNQPVTNATRKQLGQVNNVPIKL